METPTSKIHDFVLANRPLIKVREIAETVGISKDGVGYYILLEILGMWKLSVRWVPRLLGPLRPLQNSVWRGLIAIWREFLRRFVTIDETWIHWYTPETKGSNRNRGLQPANVLQRRWRLSIGRKGDGRHFLRFARSDLHRLLLCRIAEKNDPIWRRRKCSSITTTHRLIATAKLVEIGY